MKICRVVLTVVLLPVLLVMKALIFLCLFLTAVSSGLLSIVSSLLGMTALVSIFLIPIKSALILFVSAWLLVRQDCRWLRKSCLRCCMWGANGCRIG